MPDIHFVTDATDPRLDDYRDLKEAHLAARDGKFIAESEGVVRMLLASPLRVSSLLLTAPRLASLESTLRTEAERPPGSPDRQRLQVFVVPQEIMDHVAGVNVHRGCLAVGLRRDGARVPDDASTVVVLEDLVDVENLGAMIRNAAGFGVDAVMLSPRCADPYYRKAIRVSMGTVFALPIVRATRWPEDLLQLRERLGLSLVGAVLDASAIALADFQPPARLALLLGSEGPGLSAQTQSLCDARVTIPMAKHKADSLNVATAGAIFLYQLQSRRNGFTR